MTPNEIYKLKSVNETNYLSPLSGFYYNHLPEAGEKLDWANLKSERVTVKEIKNFDYDGRRIWYLATVWFDSKPVMIIQNAGREGDDHFARFVTNGPLLNEMASHIRTLCQSYECVEIVDINKDNPSLTNFYGQDLEDEFEKY